MSSLHDVYVVDAVRTPVGKIGGALAGVRPDDLAAGVISSLLARSPDLDPAAIDDVHLGNGNGAGEENRNVGRMAALLAGLPTSVPGVTDEPALRLRPRSSHRRRPRDRRRRRRRLRSPGASSR